jgi:hypothetical protein
VDKLPVDLWISQLKEVRASAGIEHYRPAWSAGALGQRPRAIEPFVKTVPLLVGEEAEPLVG